MSLILKLNMQSPEDRSRATSWSIMLKKCTWDNGQCPT